MARLNDTDRWLSGCHHEAAHCAVALQCGLPITGVFLRWEREGFRRIVSGAVDIPDHVTDPVPQALVGAAGALGEARWLERNHDISLQAAYRVAEQSSVDDAALIGRFLRDGGLDHQDVLDEALRLVDDAWWLVEAIAVELDATGYLTGRQLRRVARVA